VREIPKRRNQEERKKKTGESIGSRRKCRQSRGQTVQGVAGRRPSMK
jgi:hypothetical protein